MNTDYLKQYLEQVIIRVDFLTSADFAIDTIPKYLQEIAIKLFPIEDNPKEFITQQIQLSSDGKEPNIVQETGKIKEWNYHGRDREKQLCISRDYFFIVYRKYQSFDSMKIEFLDIVNALSKDDKKIQFKRMGLRYINNIKDENQFKTNKSKTNLKLDPFKWRVINKNLLSIFNVPFSDEKQRISRAFQVLELNYEDFNLRFQYGMYNPDFPSVIKQKQFTLDFDAYYQGLLNLNIDLEDKLIKFHSAIKKLIERC